MAGNGINIGFVLMAIFLLSGAMDAMLLDGDQATSSQLLQHLIHLENKVDSLQGEVTELKNAKDCGCASRHTVPSFMATLTTDMHICAAGQAVIFDTTTLNIGNGYDSRHGIFRAPVNGTYFFSATLTARPNDFIHVYLVKNSPSNHIGYIFTDGASNWEEAGTNVVTDLKAGDDVWILCASINTKIQPGGLQTHFSGFLISQ